MFARLEIRSESHSYPVHLGRGLLDRIGEFLQPEQVVRVGGKCAIITDQNVALLYAGNVLENLRASGLDAALYTVPAGESAKSLAEVSRLAGLLSDAGVDRRAFIVALGGGVVGDLAGFLASIYHRGIPFVQVPTTIVAQVDSSIGGKTGVNIAAGKNLLGRFYPPALVLADLDTLDTLPDREFNEGMAEAIKHAVIRDHSLLGRLVALDRRDPDALGAVIHRNLEIKAAVVARDEFEQTGERALLNFGHTVGHAVEQAAGYGHFLHGEAVGLGIVAATRLSVRKAGLSPSHAAEIFQSLRHFDLPVALPDGFATSAILASMAKDKKFEAGQIRFVLTPRIGEAYVSEIGQVGWDDLQREMEALRHSPL